MWNVFYKIIKNILNKAIFYYDIIYNKKNAKTKFIKKKMNNNLNYK